MAIDVEDKTKPHWGIVTDEQGQPVGVHTPEDRCPDDRSGNTSGPPMVNSNAFRAGWDETFGNKPN